MDKIDFKKIKLIVWDLDDTFWTGTLSEGSITPISKNIDLVKRLTELGIVNSICSKNTEEPTVEKLKELAIYDYFVFSSINWEPKGQRISTMIKEMGLRPVNVLFIDDNVQNLNETKFYEPTINISLPEIIDDLYDYAFSMSVLDKNCKRLKQYKILEEKRDQRKSYSNNTDFLYSTNTQVEIHSDCLSQEDRLYELTQRTNQLNFTKNRCTKEELHSCFTDLSYSCGYVTVKDNFGDYGIVGFYVIKNNQCVHFLFSCRTIGQGVEQYVYAKLGYPELKVVGEVVNEVDHSPAPSWINQKIDLGDKDTEKLSLNKKIVIKGACDLDIMNSFLSSPAILPEFAYIGKKHNRIEHQNHSVNILQWHGLSHQERKYLLDSCIFNDEDMFKTSMFDKDVAIVFLSSQIEPNLGIYKNKKNGLKIAFGEWCYPLTDPQYWDAYVSNTIPSFGNDFTLEWLKSFSNEWEYIGRITVEEYIDNIKHLLSLINEDAKLCIIMGVEIPYEANTQKAYENRHLLYQEYNRALRSLAKDNSRILLLPFGNFVTGQNDFLDNINHYQRRIYFEASKLAKSYIQSVNGVSVHNKSVTTLWLDQLSNVFRSITPRNSWLFKFLKSCYHSIR